MAGSSGDLKYRCSKCMKRTVHIWEHEQGNGYIDIQCTECDGNRWRSTLSPCSISVRVFNLYMRIERAYNEQR